MMRTLLLAAMLASASAAMIAHLRGAPEVEKKEEAKSMLNPLKTDERGPRGHFYYAKTCDDCFYKAPECGCQPAVEYFACLTKHCHDSKTDFFAEKCTTLSNKCFKDINLKCHGPDTVCSSKFNQLPTGGLGFDLDIDEDDAYCGPHGKCIGEIKLKAHIKNGPKEEKEAVTALNVTVASPAPGPAAAASPAPASASPASAAVVKPVKEEKKEKQEIWLECGLPKKDHADIDDKHDWILCQKEVKEEKEKCKISMFSELEAGAAKKAYCVLTEGKDGKRLTQPHWSKVINVHKKPKASNATAAVAKNSEEPKAKAPKPEAKAEEPKAEKSKPAAPEKDEKPKEEEEPLVMGDTHKLPWMVDKSERAAKRKVEEAEDAKKEKEEDEKEKVVEKKAEKPATLVKDDSGLPWMKGQASDKPAPPHKEVIG